jgi:hypothetical protein
MEEADRRARDCPEQPGEGISFGYAFLCPELAVAAGLDL